MHSTAPKSPSRDPEAPLWKNLSRNVAAILTFETLWGLGIPFGLYVSMVPAYLTALGSSKSLMGFAQSFWTALVPLQLLGGHYFASRGRVHALIRFYFMATGFRLLYDVLALFVPGMWTPASVTGGFIFSCAVYVSGYMIGQSIYMGVLTDNIPRLRRGWIFGLRTLVMVGGIFTGFAASWVLHRWASPINYRVSFLICDVVWTVSTVPLFFLRDRPRRSTAAPAAGFFRSFVAKMKVLLGNPNYRIFLFFHMLNSVAFTITTFIIPFSKERLGVPDSRLAWLSVIFLAANAGFGTLMGRLADRVGYRSVGALQSVLLVATYAVALSARSFAAVGIAYALASLVNMSTSFVLVNMSVELCPTLGVSDLTALGGTLLLPFAATVVPLAGKVIDSTGSYPSVFLMGMTIAVIALCGFSLLVREPRTGRLYVIKQINMR